MEKPRYLPERAVAQLTSLSVFTLRNYRSQGRGPVYLKVGRAVRYRPEDVQIFMEKNQIEPKSL